MQKGTVPPCKTGILVELFLGKIRRREIPDHDVFGTETLEYLIETLRVLKAPARQWGKVATFVLHKANNWVSYYFFTKTLLSLAPYVSVKMSAKILEHFVKYGEVAAVMNIASARLRRIPTKGEVMTMASYHRKKWTTSTSEPWKILLRLADKNDAAIIRKMIDEVVHEEENPPIY